MSITLRAAAFALFVSILPTGLASGQTITGIVAQSGGLDQFDDNDQDFDILLNAVLATGLDALLADDTRTFTVFAPKDIAFLRLAKDLDPNFAGDEQAAFDAIAAFAAANDPAGLDDPTPILTAVLAYHVVPEGISPFGLILRTIFWQPITTEGGGLIQPFFFFLIDQDPDLRNPRVTLPLNIDATNGVIHSINRVLLPIDV